MTKLEFDNERNAVSRNTAINKRKLLETIRSLPSEASSEELASLTNLTKPETVNLLAVLCSRKKIVRRLVLSQKSYFVYKTNLEIKR
jgi:hypothetical protein